MKKATIALLLICTAAFAQQKGSFTDTRDKKTYKTVKIGEQTWMAENLNYDAKGSKCYGEDGVMTEGESGEEKITYTNKVLQANCKRLGRLYGWNTAMKVCPSGWHLPSDKEWQILVDFAGGDEVAGKKLMAKSAWGWGNSTDDYGFSALPGSFGNSDGHPLCIVGGSSCLRLTSSSGFWWSTGEDNKSNACYRTINDFDGEGNDTIDRYCDDMLPTSTALYSVRCVKD
jgi:uncharacterized protein (TIGR02145 family)